MSLPPLQLSHARPTPWCQLRHSTLLCCAEQKREGTGNTEHAVSGHAVLAELGLLPGVQVRARLSLVPEEEQRLLHQSPYDNPVQLLQPIRVGGRWWRGRTPYSKWGGEGIACEEGPPADMYMIMTLYMDSPSREPCHQPA